MEGTVCMIHRYGFFSGLFGGSVGDYLEENGMWYVMVAIILMAIVSGVVTYKKRRKQIDSEVSSSRSKVKKEIDGSEVGDIEVSYGTSYKYFGWISFFFLAMFIIFTVFDVVYSVENAREDSYVMLVIFLIFQLVKYNFKTYSVWWQGNKITVRKFLRGKKVYNISDIDTEVKTDNLYHRVIYVNGRRAFKVNFLCVNAELFDRKLEAYGKVIKERGEK